MRGLSPGLYLILFYLVLYQFPLLSYSIYLSSALLIGPIQAGRIRNKMLVKNIVMNNGSSVKK